MNKTTIFAGAAALAFVVGASIVATGATASPMKAKASAGEKCSGIVKAGHNDCAANGHSCQGQARTDRAAGEWIHTPNGTCAKIAGGVVLPAM